MQQCTIYKDMARLTKFKCYRKGLVKVNVVSGEEVSRRFWESSKAETGILKFKAKITEKECIECGKSYTAKDFRRATCSEVCKQKRIDRQKQRTRDKKKKLLDDARPKNIPCRFCGKIFSPPRSYQIFCNPQCTRDAHRPTRTTKRP
jgi:hypothetical protein